MKKGDRQLLLILTLALFLRCLFINSRNIQYDDAFSILLARQNFGDIISGTAADTMPPLFYFVLHVWSLVSNNIWWQRVLSIFFSTGGLLFLFFIIRGLFDRQAALWAIFFGAISPFQIYHAQDIRMYALLQFCQILYLFSFIKIYRNSKNKAEIGFWLVFVISGAFSLYTHNLAVFFLILPNVFLLISKQWQLFKRIVYAQAIISVLFLPWIFFIPEQITKIQTAFWTPRPGLLEIIQAISIMTVSLSLGDVLLYICVAASLLVFIIAVYLNLRMPPMMNLAKRFLIVFIYGLPLILFAASYVMRPIFVPRAFLISSLLYFGLLGVLVTREYPRIIKILLVAGITTSSLLSLPNFYQYDGFPRSPFRSAAAFLSNTQRNTEIIIHDNKLSYFPITIFYEDAKQVFIADEQGSHNDTLAYGSQVALNLFPKSSIEEAASSHESVDFVVFTKAIEDYVRMGEGGHPNLAWLENHYQLTSKTEFNDLSIYSFQR